MVTERYISHRHISSCMTGYYAGGSSQENSFDYQTFLNNSFTGNPFFDAFITELSGEMQIYDGINPYVLDALRPLITKADSFLRRHAHMSYEEFLKRSKLAQEECLKAQACSPHQSTRGKVCHRFPPCRAPHGFCTFSKCLVLDFL